MSIKGYPDRQKTDAGANNFATVAPVREGQFALDVVSHAYFQTIGADAAEAGSTSRIIKATAHAALVGDLISWTAGTLNTREYRVAEIPDADHITVAEVMAAAPANGDAFAILRQKAATVSAAGGITFDTTGLATSAKQDTGNTSLSSIDTKLTTLRQGRAYADSAAYAYSGGSVTSGAWVQLIAATAADINELLISETSGHSLELGVGALGVEARKLLIPPGGYEGPVPLRIASGARVSIRALSTATGTSGEFLLTGLT